MTFVLVIYIYAGMMANGDSVTLLNQEFSSKEKCDLAGKRAESLVNGSAKTLRWFCVEK